MAPRRTAIWPARSAAAGWRESTTFRREGSGRKRGGIDSHVARPMMTALRLSAELVVDVTSLKCAMSAESRHGSLPCFPMPIDVDAAATITENVRGMAGGEADIFFRSPKLLVRF